ncbi:NlpC/P60 family protein [Streptomyces bambusae]|uniref:C40 family peptidase n=1 Tax=Streptomyces bambusae TaxID=1550616 RepID=UPI001CFE8697|nr:C40 family peptidase [Streptomyces bambusae]MCB5167172.1 NlpC/P60 family protein [Streptomyces bambusae]
MASHRRPVTSGPDRSTTLTVLSAAAATAAAALAAAPASAAPADPASGARARVDRLFEEAEQATERFNKAGEKAAKLRGEIRGVQESVARGQDRINTMRGLLGTYAGAQYRSGGVDPAVELMLSEDPDGYLEKAAALDRLAGRQAGQLAELHEAQRKLAQQRRAASHKLAELDALRADVARQKRAVTAKLAAARRILNAMPSEERAAFERANRSSGRGVDLPEPSGLGPASGRAAAAVAAARAAVGRPYVWGATGPSGFDCSGLMVWSYRQAGVSLPRTSQAQRFAGRHVPLSEARPGDLVTYRSDASHVGMYVGNGQVVHAPYPGAPVRYDPVGMMPVSAVTRP